MAEVLIEFDTVLRYREDGTWSARACVKQRADGLWEGFLEFTPRDGEGPSVSTERETEQSSRDGVLYWAQGLTQVYLEGALVRAVARSRPRPKPNEANLEE